MSGPLRGARPWLLVAALAGLAGGAGASVAADGAPLTVRITSPMGRTGEAGSVRIVAQVDNAADTPPFSR